MATAPWPAPPPSFRSSIPFAGQANGLSSILGGFNDWRGDNRNLLLGLSAGLLSGDFKNIPLGIQSGMQADEKSREQKKATALAETQANYTETLLKDRAPDLYAAFKGGVPIGAVWSEYLNRTGPQASGSTITDNAQQRAGLADQYGLQGSERQTFILTGNLPGGNQTGRAGVGQPITMRNKTTGETIAVQPMTVGPGQNLMTGQPLQNPEDWVYDPIGVAGDKTTVVADAKTAAAARAALPGAELAAEQTLKAIDIIRNDTAGASDQFGNTLGVPNRSIPAWSGVSPRANWQANFSTAESGAFMAARQALKGGGQITDYEGQKASAAYSRMQQAVNLGDKENFDLALADFEQAVSEGLAKLRQVANGEYAAGQSAVTGQPSGNTTSSGIQWSVTP